MPERWLPNAVESHVLAACLLPTERAQGELDAWCAEAGGSPRALAAPGSGSPALGPLLGFAIEERRLRAPDELRAYALAARARERHRWTEYRRVASDAVAALRSSGVVFLPLKGLALSERVYPLPDLRHSHDIDVLIQARDSAMASAALGAAGFLPAQAGGPAEPMTHLMHSSGLPFVLHRGLFMVPPYNAFTADVWQRAHQGEGGSLTMELADALIHVVVHASTTRHRESLLWVADAAHVCDRLEAGDWEHVVARGRQYGMSLPLLVGLKYLLRRHAVAIPQAAVELLSDVAATERRPARELVYRNVRANRAWEVLWSGTGWRDRARLLAWRVWPSRTYLDWLATVHDERPGLGRRYAHLVGALKAVARRALRLAAPVAQP